MKYFKHTINQRDQCHNSKSPSPKFMDCCCIQLLSLLSSSISDSLSSPTAELFCSISSVKCDVILLVHTSVSISNSGHLFQRTYQIWDPLGKSNSYFTLHKVSLSGTYNILSYFWLKLISELKWQHPFLSISKFSTQLSSPNFIH